MKIEAALLFAFSLLAGFFSLFLVFAPYERQALSVLLIAFALGIAYACARRIPEFNQPFAVVVFGASFCGGWAMLVGSMTSSGLGALPAAVLLVPYVVLAGGSWLVINRKQGDDN